jgi:hypothetical protein
MQKLKAFSVIVLALLLAACAQEVALVAPTVASPLSTTSPLSTPTPPAAKKPSLPTDAVIVYQRSGGLAGRTEEWTIYADGRVVSGDGRTGQLSPQEVANLVRQIEAAGFGGWRDTYGSPAACCDRFTYNLTVRLAGQTKMVTTIDAASEEPATLRTILGQVTQLVAKATGK